MKFLDEVVNAGLVQIVQTPTHEKGNILDLVLTNIPDRIERLDVVCTNKLSDHHMLITEISAERGPSPSIENVPDFAKADYDHLRSDLAVINWHKELKDCSATEAWDRFKSIFKQICDKRIPKKVRRRKSQPLWLSLIHI